MSDAVSARHCRRFTRAGSLAEGPSLWRSIPDRRIGLEARVEFTLQKCTRHMSEFNTKMTLRCSRTPILTMGFKHKRTEILPIAAELRHHDARQVVREFIAFIGTEERLAGPELLDLLSLPEFAMTRLHLLRT